MRGGGGPPSLNLIKRGVVDRRGVSESVEEEEAIRTRLLYGICKSFL